MVGQLEAYVVTGGLGGVMAAAARGATSAGGVAIGIIPGIDPRSAFPPHSFTIATGMGEARNAVVVNSADVVIAIGLGWGTVSEIALARRAGKHVVQIDGSQPAESGLTTWSSAELADPAELVQPLIAFLGTILGDAAAEPLLSRPDGIQG